MKEKPKWNNPYLPIQETYTKKPKKKPSLRKTEERERLLDFWDTCLGRNLKLRAPQEFELLLGVCKNFKRPDPDLIEAVSYASINPYFHSPQFRDDLIKYRKYGCAPQNEAQAITADELCKIQQEWISTGISMAQKNILL